MSPNQFFMLLPQLLRNLSFGALIAAQPLVCWAVPADLARIGGETAPFGTPVGDQTMPHVSLAPPGGFMGAYIVWQDSRTGTNQHIYSGELYSDLTADPVSFDVSANRTEHQEQPRVAMLRDAGAAYVWQQGQPGAQHICASFFDPFWGFGALDVRVNQSVTTFQETPDVAGLASGDVAIVWTSLNQEANDSGRGVYARLYSPQGAALSGEFLVNQFTPYDQRNPAVAALAGGGFAVVWVSQQQRSVANPSQPGTVDVYGRMFGPNGTPLGDEFLINIGNNTCVSPRVAGGADGGLMVVWAEQGPLANNNGWEVVARPFTSQGVGGVASRVNTQRRLDHVLPQVCAAGGNYLAVWVSLGQDGSQEGVFAQLLKPSGQLSGAEFRVNGSTRGPQTQPAVATDGDSQVLVVWSGFTSGSAGMDVNAQLYIVPQLPALDAPVVADSGVTKLIVSWQEPAGQVVDHYEVFLDGASLPSAVVTNATYWLMKGLAPGEAHAFQMTYVVTSGVRAPLSAATTGATGLDANHDGISDAWQALYWGPNPANWPLASADSNGNGLSNYNKFLAGLNPLVRASLLSVQLRPVATGFVLEWSSVPGKLYQVQSRTSLSAPWAGETALRIGAAGGVTAATVSPTGSVFYRVSRVP